MMLSLYTNVASMSSINSLTQSNAALTIAMQRLGTGKRINAAADDAAGLQIATRLQAQSNGMAVAKRNISDAKALLQTAEGAFDELTNVLYRMKDLATQAANGTNAPKDHIAIKGEFDELGKELNHILSNTRYGGEEMFGNDLLMDEITFQIGASSSEVMTLDISDELVDLKDLIADNIVDEGNLGLFDDSRKANLMITTIADALDEVAALRAKLGASINRLDHSFNNLSNMKDNTDVAIGTIRDADYAAEATEMNRSGMLALTSMVMLNESNSITDMVLMLLL